MQRDCIGSFHVLRPRGDWLLVSTVTGTDTLKPSSSCELQVSDDCSGLQFRPPYHFDSLTASLAPVMRGVFLL